MGATTRAAAPLLMKRLHLAVNSVKIASSRRPECPSNQAQCRSVFSIVASKTLPASGRSGTIAGFPNPLLSVSYFGIASAHSRKKLISELCRWVRVVSRIPLRMAAPSYHPNLIRQRGAVCPAGRKYNAGPDRIAGFFARSRPFPSDDVRSRVAAKRVCLV